MIFTGVEIDAYTDTPMLECAAPVYYNGEALAAYQQGARRSAQTLLIVTAVLFFMEITGALTLGKRIVQPLEQLTKRINSQLKGGAAFTMEDVYRTGDEIEILAESFADLTKRTQDYISEIISITAEKKRIGTELALATRIQADMLPNIYPAFPERPEFDIYATMTPAKEVGGDFYDFFLIDDDHLGLVIADVSGKGVPAALFMMISKMLVQNYAMLGKSPAEALKAVNHQICSNNREEMFGTDRMLEALNIEPTASPETILRHVREAVNGFVKDAEQFDDLTMLCLEFREKGTDDSSAEASDKTAQ